MKNTILIIGSICIIINTLAGVIFQNYSTSNMIFGDVSILITVTLIYNLFGAHSSDGIKIGGSFIFAISGILRFICALSTTPNFKNDFVLFLFLIILAIEVVITLVYFKIRDK